MNRKYDNYKLKISEIKSYIEDNIGASQSAIHFKKKYKDNYIQIQREFKQRIGLSVSAYANKIKMEKAKELLPSMLCEEVAQVVGYKSTHFTVAFKKYFGKTPAEFKYGAKDGYKIIERGNLVEQVKQYVDEHIDENPTFYKLAPLYKIAKADLKKAFITHMGMSLSDYIRDKQIERAKSLILMGKSIKEVSEIMKYAHVSAFSEYFKWSTGVSASEYYESVKGESIRAQSYRNLDEKDIKDIEVFVRKNLEIKDLEKLIRSQFELPIHKIDDGFIEFRGQGLSKTIILERLNIACKKLKKKISISQVKDLVGFYSEKELLLALIKNGMISLHLLSKTKELNQYLVTEQQFKTLLNQYCYDHLNEFPNEETLSCFFNISIDEFSILREVYLEGSLSAHIEGLKMKKAKIFLNEGMLAKSVSVKLGYGYSNHMSAVFKKHVGMTMRSYQKGLGLHPKRNRNPDEVLLAEVESIVNKHYLKRNLQGILRKTYPKHYRTILKKFRITYGKSVGLYAFNAKMDKARELLSSGNSAEKVSQIIGYANPSSFSTAYRKHFGVTPLDTKPIKNVGRKAQDPKQVVSKFRKYVRNHIDEPLSFTRIAEILGIAKENLKKAYFVVYGNMIETYIEQARIERAKSLIRKGHKIIEIARIMQYADGTSFAAFFKKGTGKTAREYLASIKQSQNPSS